jgi:hypothetical protein
VRLTGQQRAPVEVEEVISHPDAGGHVPMEELAPVERSVSLRLWMSMRGRGGCRSSGCRRSELQLHVRQVADGRRLLTRWRAAYEAATATHEAAASCPAGDGSCSGVASGGRLLLGVALGF